MFCIWCGAKLPDDSQFCTNCGKRLTPSGTASEASPQAPAQPSVSTMQAPRTPAQPSAPTMQVPRAPEPPRQPPQAKPARSKGPLIAVLLVIICVLIAAVIFLVIRMNSGRDVDNMPPSVSDTDTRSGRDRDEENGEDDGQGIDWKEVWGQGSDSAPEDSGDSAELPAPPAEQGDDGLEGAAAIMYIIPDSDSRYLTEEDLYGLTAEELRLARNEIYARHGRMFSDQELQDYFNGQPWYEGTIAPEDFTQSMLNDYEIQNAALILDYENGR